MPMSASQREILRKALSYRYDESFEEALGRAVRSADGAYADYVELVGAIRERARSRKVDMRTAARDLKGQP